MSAIGDMVENARDDGGPAFPEFQIDTVRASSTSGMSLRDWLAGQALAGFVSIAHDDGEPIMGAADTASAAYNYADAMLAERSRQP